LIKTGFLFNETKKTEVPLNCKAMFRSRERILEDIRKFVNIFLLQRPQNATGAKTSSWQ